MRLAVHKTHKPVAYTQDSLAAKAGVSADAIHRAESDELSLKGASIQAICRALSMPLELLTCSMNRWLKVVNNIGLEARILAAGRKDLAARARKVSSTPNPKSQVSAL
jgi:transcriptional regulator with XRE-family HTH domain